ncbi:hypothetical protein [Patulibacter minatonensis]|uniref:hypothetical protein n=1 Tax=Patulibacter minatonensis TaxID=298163 RepID=UPI00047B1AB2|nr:hypothetical protein [Patulibacter minatonensis]
MTPRLLRTALVAATLAVLAVPSAASAANSLEVGIADENVLNGNTPGGADATVAQWKASGVQDVRIFAQWDKLVPQDTKDDTKAPAGFNAEDPASYDFANLDAKIDVVAKYGLNVTLVVTGPGPVWGSSEPARKNGTWKPDPAQFAKFAAAITKNVGPKVARYIVWNEPNQGYWLQPQYSCVARKTTIPPFKCTSVAPHLYRELARAGYDAIHANDPDARVAVGATSSTGIKLPDRANSTTAPLTFLRNMACVNSKYRSVRSGDCKGFKAVTGDALAYHPHSTTKSPGQADPVSGNARMADLPRLIKVIDKLTARKRLKVSGAKRLPLWLDEYGYQTNPPDKRDGHQSPAVAAAYLQWGWSLAARNPRVETLTQYEWFDEELGEDKNGDQTFNKWQSGLFTVDGKPKALAAVFANPIFGWYTKSSGYIWGQVRPGDAATTVRLQQGGKASSSFKDYKTITTDKYGIFQVKVPRSTTTRYRFVYTDPNTQAEVTSAAVPLRRPTGK